MWMSSCVYMRVYVDDYECVFILYLGLIAPVKCVPARTPPSDCCMRAGQWQRLQLCPAGPPTSRGRAARRGCRKPPPLV